MSSKYGAILRGDELVPDEAIKVDDLSQPDKQTDRQTHALQGQDVGSGLYVSKAAWKHCIFMS